MRTKLLIAGAATMFAMLLIAIAIAATIFIRRFDAIEIEQTHAKAEQVERALQADLNQLAISTRDYAEWDDAQQFVLSRSAEFLRANFSYESLSGMKVDAVAILAADGTPIYSAVVDAAAERLVEPAPAGDIGTLQQVSIDHASTRSLESTERIEVTPRGPLSFSAIEIRRSDKSAATGAVLVFARYLNEAVIARVRETSHLPVEMLLVKASAQHLPPAALAWALDSQHGSADSFVRTADERHVTGYALLRDIRRQPLGLLATTGERTVSQLGRKTTTALLGSIGCLLLVCALALAALFLSLRKSWHEHAKLEQRHRNILGHLDESIVLADPQTDKLLDANAALLRALDYAEADVEYLTLRQVYIDLPDPIPMPAAAAEPVFLECRMRARDGHLIDSELTLTSIIDEGQVRLCIVGRDLSARKHAESQLRESETRLARIAEQDEVSGLPNRIAVHQRLPRLVHEVALRATSMTVFFIGVDRFKTINDSSGHAIGDRVLRTMGQRLRDTFGDALLLARMGGDEFLLVVPGGESTATRAAAQRILDVMSQPLQIDSSTSLTLTVSVGSAIYPTDGLDSESLLKRADIALYEAKEGGRNTYRTFADQMDVRLSENVALEQDLRRAIGTKQIYVDFQPVVDLNTGLLVSFEALARWRHEELGQISPGRFIPVAEKSGLIVQLGEEIVRQVVRQLHQWRAEGVPLAPVAINVAPVQFERTEFCTMVHELLLQFDIDAQWLAFEVTESALLQDSKKHVVAIDTLRHAGSKVYIDDFGTGFSNFSYLKTLPVDAVKIDQGFVRGIEHDEGDVAIVSGIVTMANKLKLRTIAEGIESATVAEKLRSMGCQYGQGYYFSKPMPASHCRALLVQLGETRRFTETVKIRAFRAASAA